MTPVEIMLCTALMAVVFAALVVVPRLQAKANMLDKIIRWRGRLPLASHELPQERQFMFLKPVVVLAHRGLSRYATEGTGVALRLAALTGANGVEVDVRFTRDGVPVLFHDRKLSRLAGDRRAVEELLWEEVGSIPVMPANRILGLDRFLADFACHFDRIVLDLKDIRDGGADPRMLDTLERLLRSRDAAGRVILDAASVPFVKAASARGLEVSIREPRIPLEQVRALGIRRVSIGGERAKALYGAGGWAGLDLIAICPPHADEAMWFFERGAWAVITDAVEETLDALLARGFIAPVAGTESSGAWAKSPPSPLSGACSR